eukprot:6055329-Prymnesium_polylepis.1
MPPPPTCHHCHMRGRGHVTYVRGAAWRAPRVEEEAGGLGRRQHPKEVTHQTGGMEGEVRQCP